MQRLDSVLVFYIDVQVRFLDLTEEQNGNSVIAIMAISTNILRRAGSLMHLCALPQELELTRMNLSKSHGRSLYKENDQLISTTLLFYTPSSSTLPTIHKLPSHDATTQYYSPTKRTTEPLPSHPFVRKNWRKTKEIKGWTGRAASLFASP